MADSQIPAVSEEERHLGASYNENVNHASETSSTTIAEKHAEQPALPTAHHSHLGKPDQVGTFNNQEYRYEADGTREITEDECRDELGFGFSTWKKW
jgi:hypothetical protein